MARCLLLLVFFIVGSATMGWAMSTGQVSPEAHRASAIDLLQRGKIIYVREIELPDGSILQSYDVLDHGGHFLCEIRLIEKKTESYRCVPR